MPYLEEGRERASHHVPCNCRISAVTLFSKQWVEAVGMYCEDKADSRARGRGEEEGEEEDMDWFAWIGPCPC